MKCRVGGCVCVRPAVLSTPHLRSSRREETLSRDSRVCCTMSFHWSSEMSCAQAGMPSVGRFTAAMVLFTSSTWSGEGQQQNTHTPRFSDHLNLLWLTAIRAISSDSHQSAWREVLSGLPGALWLLALTAELKGAL